jgi:hypothetical protein
LYISSKAQTAIPCSINYATTNRKALSGDLAGFNNANWSWQCPVNYNTGNQDPNNPLSTADNAIDSRLSNIIKNELGEIIYRNSGGMAERYNTYYKGWGNSNPAMPATLLQIPYCGSGIVDLYGSGNAPYNINDPFNNLVSDKLWRANPTKRNLIYNDYQMYNTTAILYPESKDNIIYPMINIIKSTTNNKIATYTINIDPHYKNQRSYLNCNNNISYDRSIRGELFNKTTQLWNINTVGDLSLPANNFSAAFIEQVKQNVDAILTMMLNGVDIKYVEIGNEHGRVYGDTYEWFNKSKHDVAYGSASNDVMFTNFKNLPAIPNNEGLTNVIWSSSDLQKFYTSTDVATFNVLNQSGSYTQASFDAYGALCHMYINVIKNAIGAETGINGRPNISSKRNSIKFGISMDDNYDENSDPFTAAYLNYLFTHQDAINGPLKIGFTGFIIHPYLNLSTTPLINTITNLDAFFKELRDKSTAYINSKYRKKSASITNDPYYKRGSVFYNNTFYNRLPSHAEIWLTEWNARNSNKDISNTLLDAMYYMDAQIAMQDINTGINMVAPFTPKNNLCQLANYQVLFGPSNSGNAQPGETILGLNYDNHSGINDGISRQAVFYAHKILKPLFTVKPDYIANVNGGFTFPTGITKDSVSFRTYIKENVATGDSLAVRYCNKLGCFSNWHSCFTDKEIYIYFNNKSNRDYKIDLSAALTGQTGRVYTIEQNRMYATKLSASRGITTFRTDPVLYETTGNINTDKTIQIQNGAKFSYYNTDGTTVSTAVKNFIISKYSLGYIKITLRVYSTPQPNLCALPQRIATSEIKDIDDSKKITDKQIIYPNPTTGLVNLNVQLSEPVDKYTIEVFSVDGRVVLSEIHNEKLDGNTYVNNTINISNQPNGVYFIRIISDKNVLLNNKVLLNK